MKRKPLLIRLSWTPKATTMNASTWFLCTFMCICSSYKIYQTFYKKVLEDLCKIFEKSHEKKNRNTIIYWHQ